MRGSLESSLVTLVWTMLGLVACGEGSLLFAEEPRACEQLGELCPAAAPVLLALAELDGERGAEVITAGLGGELRVATMTDEGPRYTTTRVPVGWGAELSRCSGGGGEELLFYRAPEQWWLWRASKGRLEHVDGGRVAFDRVVACLDLGGDADTVVSLAGSSLTLPDATFELQLLVPGSYAIRGTPRGTEGAEFSLFAARNGSAELYVGVFDRGAEAIISETTWTLGEGSIDAMEILGDDLFVAASEGDAGELLILRDVDPTELTAPEAQREPVPWAPALLRIAELDGDLKAEVVVAPRPASEVAVFGLASASDEPVLLELGFEAVDVAAGDTDGDGTDELYGLDVRGERVVEL